MASLLWNLVDEVGQELLALCDDKAGVVRQQEVENFQGIQLDVFLQVGHGTAKVGAHGRKEWDHEVRRDARRYPSHDSKSGLPDVPFFICEGMGNVL